MNSQAEEIKKFDNDNISVEAHLEPGCQVKLDVLVHKEFVTKSYQDALHRVRKEVSLPGFRKGKAPDSLIITHYAKAIDNEWRDVLLNNAFQEVIKLTPYAPLKANAKSIKSHLKEIKSAKEEARLSYEFEYAPEAPSIDLSKISISKPKEISIGDDQIDAKIEEARLSLATWEDVLDRTVEEEDFVRLDLAEIKEGEEIPDFTDQRFQVTPSKMAPWLRTLVVGMRVGESKEGMSSPDEAFLEEEDKSKFQPSLFKVTVNKIEKPILPDLDEAFAKRVGVNSMEEVKTAIRRQLEHHARSEQNQKLLKEIEDHLTREYSFDLPKSLIEKDSKMLAEQDEEGAEKKSRLQAKNRLTLYYLLRKYNAEHNISVTNEDLNLELNKLLQQFPKEMLPQIAKSLNEEIYTAILSEVVVRKGLEDLLKKSGS